MSIKSCIDEKTNREMFRVTAVAKSKIIPGLKVQKQESDIPTKIQAERRYQALRDIANRELMSRELQGSLWGDFVEKWSLAMVTGEEMDVPVTRTTADDYSSVVRAYTKSWWKKPAISITRYDIKMALEQITKDGKSYSRKRYLKIALTRAFQWGIDTRKIRGLEDNPVRGVPIGKMIEKKQSVLSQSEAKTLLQAGQRFEHPWYPVWALALMTGMRSGELHALEWNDVDFENELIQVTKSYNGRMKATKCTKSGCWRTVPMSDELKAFLQELKIKAHGNKHVLPRFNDWDSGNQANILRQFCTGLGITLIRFHDLRACFATYLLRDGIASAQVMKICGWKDLKTMQRYLRLAAVDIKGVTNNLRLLPDKEVMGRVIEMVRGSN